MAPRAPEAPALPGPLPLPPSAAALRAAGASCASSGTGATAALFSHSAADGAEIGPSRTRADHDATDVGRAYVLGGAAHPLDRYDRARPVRVVCLPPSASSPGRREPRRDRRSVPQRYQRTPENGYMSWSLLGCQASTGPRIATAASLSLLPALRAGRGFSWDRAAALPPPSVWALQWHDGLRALALLLGLPRNGGRMAGLAIAGATAGGRCGHGSRRGRPTHRNDLQYEEPAAVLVPLALVGRSRRGPHKTTVSVAGHRDPGGFWGRRSQFLVRFQGGDPERAVRAVLLLPGRRADLALVRMAVHRTTARSTRTGRRIPGHHRGESTMREPRRRSAELERDERPGIERCKIWPLGKVRTGEDQQDVHVVDLNPFQELDFVDEHYAWLWGVRPRAARRSFGALARSLAPREGRRRGSPLPQRPLERP